MVRAAIGGRYDGSVLDFAVNAGTRHFVAQRVTAIILTFLGLWFAVSIIGIDLFAHGVVVAFVADPLNVFLLTLLTVTLAYHSYLGVQVVIEDYVHASGLKAASLIASRLAHVLIAIALTYSIFKIGMDA
jgi:succinate dehydrogenase / fumarate reductase membrane anchor subunit